MYKKLEYKMDLNSINFIVAVIASREGYGWMNIKKRLSIVV